METSTTTTTTVTNSLRRALDAEEAAVEALVAARDEGGEQRRRVTRAALRYARKPASRQVCVVGRSGPSSTVARERDNYVDLGGGTRDREKEFVSCVWVSPPKMIEGSALLAGERRRRAVRAIVARRCRNEARRAASARGARRSSSREKSETRLFSEGVSTGGAFRELLISLSLSLSRKRARAAVCWARQGALLRQAKLRGACACACGAAKRTRTRSCRAIVRARTSQQRLESRLATRPSGRARVRTATRRTRAPHGHARPPRGPSRRGDTSVRPPW